MLEVEASGGQCLQLWFKVEGSATKVKRTAWLVLVVRSSSSNQQNFEELAMSSGIIVE